MKKISMHLLWPMLALVAGLAACKTSTTHGPDLDKGQDKMPPAIRPSVVPEATPPGNGSSTLKSSTDKDKKGPSDTKAVTNGNASKSNAAASPFASDPKAKAELGKPAPDFTLHDLDGKTVRLSDYRGKTIVLEWFDPTCPYCKYAYSDEGPLKTMPERYMAQGIVWLSINSAGPDARGSAVDLNQSFVKEHGMKAPLLLDPTGEVGKKYEAKTTPHMYVINEKGLLVYHGALDNAPIGKVPADATKMNYIDAALNDLKSGHAVTAAETRPYG